MKKIDLSTSSEQKTFADAYKQSGNCQRGIGKGGGQRSSVARKLSLHLLWQFPRCTGPPRHGVCLYSNPIQSRSLPILLHLLFFLSRALHPERVKDGQCRPSEAQSIFVNEPLWCALANWHYKELQWEKKAFLYVFFLFQTLFINKQFPLLESLSFFLF